MQKLQNSVFSIVKTTNLSPAVFSFLQPTEDNNSDKTPLGGILNDTKHGWLALGPKFCVVDLRTGLKVAARTFGTPYSNSRTTVTSVVELITPLTENSKQLIISLQCEDFTSNICVFHINGSQILRCIQTDLVVTELAVCDEMPDGPFTCFDGVVMAGTKTGEIFAFDLNRSGLIQALKDITQGYEHMIQNESNPANLTFLPLKAIHQIEEQRDLVLVNNDHLAILLNESSVMDGQYIFHNPDGTVRMKAKRDHIRVTVLQYIPQLGSLAVGYNFGAFQIWNLLTLDLEFTSQVNVECLPVTHFGFQEPCDDPRAFCYLWVVFSLIDRFEEEEFPLAVMYSLTYQGKRMLSDTKCLYQDFSMATIRFQAELSAMEDAGHLTGGKCVSCHTYSVNSSLGSEGEDTMLNICQLVWECWGDNANASSQYGMLLFDLDQWYKDQMPATYRLESNVFMSASWCSLAAGACVTLDVRLEPASVAPYAHATRLEEHLYPNSIQYNCICLNTSEACVLSTVGIQRQIISSMDDVGPTALLSPGRLYHACVTAGLAPMYADTSRSPSQQRRYLLSVALEARLSRFLKRCAHDWATGSHAGAGCTLPFLVDWCWQRAIELKENARELTAPLFSSSALPDRNVVRCLEHCVQQLTQLTGLLDAILTKCCNLVVPDALSEMEEKYKGIGCVSLYLRVVQWFLRVGLLPERLLARDALPYPAHHLLHTYTKRRMKLQRLEDNSPVENNVSKSCSLLYIDQLIENEFGGERIHEMWLGGGSECNGLYPPPSLYSLLRLYLLPDIAEEQKHSLVLYLLVDYSVVYDDVRHEAVIRRLMQFPTMFGLSNTAIKATQAFWHLDHRDFDFALDQLQCLTGNTLSEWQHSVVLSSLLAQKKTQAALQYLHVRKPAPIQYKDPETMNSSRVGDQDKLDDWQACCSLYLARGLAFEALDVARSCVRSARSTDDQVRVLNYFFRVSLRYSRSQDKLDDWQACCSLYLARGLAFEALDVARSCVRSARSTDDQVRVLNYFFRAQDKLDDWQACCSLYLARGLACEALDVARSCVRSARSTDDQVRVLNYFFRAQDKLDDWQACCSLYLARGLAFEALDVARSCVRSARSTDDQVRVLNYFFRDQDKLDDWQACCSLYLARGLAFEALDVARSCVRSARSTDDQVRVLNYFFRGCRNTGHLSKILQVTLLPLEEEVFIKYLQSCNESQTSDILVMYYLQQARYLEAEQYNSKLRHSKTRAKDATGSAESLADLVDREGARDTIVEVVCASLPNITNVVRDFALSDKDTESHGWVAWGHWTKFYLLGDRTLDREGARDTIVEVVCASLPNITNVVRDFALSDKDTESHVMAAKPMSVFIQAKSPKNTFTYKSSFIQDTIENASETWINKPKMRRGIKRALNIEETPFICTPKMGRNRSILSDLPSESTPPKRAKLDFGGTPKTPKFSSTIKLSPELSKQMASLLDMPLVQSPDSNLYDRAETPHSILKIRRNEAMERDAPSPVDSRYLGDSDDELLETASNQTHYSDSTNKHLRFTIPTASESGSTPSPVAAPAPYQISRDVSTEREMQISETAESERDGDSRGTTGSHAMDDSNPMESPPKKLAVEVKSRKTYKDTVKARRSLSISANSSLSDDPNTSIESIADIPVTLINPRYSGERRRRERESQDSVRVLIERERELGDRERQDSVREVIERERQDSVRELIERERELGDRERQDSVRGLIEREHELGERERQDTVREIGERDADMREIREGEMEAPKTPTGRRGIRAVSGESTPLINRSRSVTPERQDSPRTPLRTSRVTRSRSRTPEVSPRGSPLAPIIEQPKQEATSEPHAASSTLSVPRNLRSRSRTPERVDKPVMESPRLEAITESPTKSSNSESSSSPSRRSLRSRSRTPEVEIVQEPARPASPRTLRSRPKTPEKLMSPKSEHSTRTKKSLSRIVLEANTFAKMMEKNDPEPTPEEPENVIECTPMKTVKQVPSLMDVTLSPIVNKSVLQSSTDSVLSETVEKESNKTVDKSTTDLGLKPLPTFTTIHETYFEKSVLHSYQSSVGDSSESAIEDKEVKEDNTTNAGLKSLPAFTTINDTGFNKSVLQSYESSVADTSSIHEEKETKITEVSVTKPFSKFTEIVETNFERSVLKSYQSSMAETSNEVSKDESSNKSALKDASLITNDSDVEMKEDECQSKIDSLSAVIQKEKERIVDIEREINELEGDMTDDSSESTASDSSGDEEILVPADVNEESDETSESSSESGSGDEEVISIKDTDSDESSSDNKLQIDENTSSSEKQITPLRNIEVVVEVNVESDDKAEEKETVEESNSNVDPMNQAQISMLTDDNSVIESEQSNANLNYSDEVKTSEEPKIAEAVPMDTGELKPAVEIIVMVEEIAPAEIAETDKLDTAVTKSIDAVDSIAPAEKVDPISTTAEAHVKTIEEPKVDTADAKSTKEKSASIESPVEKDNKQTGKDDKPTEKEVTTQSEEGETEKKEITTQSEEGETEKESHKPAPRTRKCAQSTSSNKSVTETKEEPRTPVTRKRTQSTASNKSVTESEPKTPENVAEETSTPSRRRAKTPSSVEVRKIITRRASKEMSEKLDESKEALDDSVTATPRRRSTRSRTKNIDDNESVASESSIRSTRSRASEDAGDIKAAPIRKGRKSILSTKPDLSVIPEMIVEEESKSSEDIVNEYSNARRLTRHQKTVLESWLEPAASPRSRRRTSAASRHSASDRDDDDADSTHSFDVQSMDRIALLAKQDFEGSPDFEEYPNVGSPDSIASDASKQQRRSRLARAGSESKTTPRAVKKTRSISVDIGEGSEAGSPAGSPLRRASRRASFNKACEALHTPIKGRRTSTDTRKEAESPQDSPAVSESESVATPARRSRRAASTQSNASQTKLDTSKRSKKTSALDESKDKKK
ncbi:serine/arginine repetitive matrix protein 2 [Ostrinia nubilalis]|uniref:serine/arginine repetitive matrix protein 2 n=1 Tax=Ostrinia nubilalis TaxID=29057 RepID=UPI00308265B2